MVPYLLHIWNILLELAPSLLLGLFIAGMMHAFLPENFLSQQLRHSNSGSVLRAVLFGIPLPLCSCGVIPATLALRRDGASPGAATGFLISTPQTGVDSLLVTASFLGWPFALFKIGAAFIMGMSGGMLVNFFASRDDNQHPLPTMKRHLAESDKLSSIARLGIAVRYAIFDILSSIANWLIIGILLSALITLLLPADSLHSYSWSQGIASLFVALAIATPLYVCTTGSVPIAAALLAAGLPAGSAMVFLLAGPATNVATIGAISKGLGKKVTLIYLLVVTGFSLIFGFFLNELISTTGASGHSDHHSGAMDSLSAVSAAFLVLLLAYIYLIRIRNIFLMKKILAKKGDAMIMRIIVSGMTCQHCVKTVKKVLESHPTILEAQPDLQSGQVVLTLKEAGQQPAKDELAALLQEAGYELTALV